MLQQLLMAAAFALLLQYSSTVSSFNEAFTFNGFSNANLNLSGASCIKSDGILVLTNNTGKVIGHAFYPTPLQFKDINSSSLQSFSTSFVFSISPKYSELGGHGLAFVISPSSQLNGALSNQYLGLPNQTRVNTSMNHFLAVEFDTVQNVELGDINDNHVGIDIDSLISSISKPAAYENQQGITLKSGVAVQVWIEYTNGGEYGKLLNVTLSPLGVPKPKWPLISFPVDLSSIFGEFMYVGFSASTGLLTAAHNVMGWSFQMGSGPTADLDPSKLPLPAKASKVVKSGGFVAGITLASLAFVLLVILAAFHIWHKMRDGGGAELEEWETDHYGARRFEYSELVAAARGFGESNLIGSGGFGSVYRGIIPSTGLEVAIKRMSDDSTQGMREFVAEITIVGRLRHRNLVQLHGWCKRKDELLLVYDYFPNGSLDQLLFNTSTTTSAKRLLTWDKRFKILQGVAQALLYLHEGCDHRVLHRDIKPSNILLDACLNAKLGDFGLARICDHHDVHPQTTQIVGTLGYLAPELTRTGKSTTSTDVFSYGTLMLEVATGRKPIEPHKDARELVLVDWAREVHARGEIMTVVDPALEESYKADEMELVLRLGLLCSHPLPANRPSIRRVVQYLMGDAILPPEIQFGSLDAITESSDSFTDQSDPCSCRMASTKSSSSFSSHSRKNVTPLASSST